MDHTQRWTCHGMIISPTCPISCFEKLGPNNIVKQPPPRGEIMRRKERKGPRYCSRANRARAVSSRATQPAQFFHFGVAICLAGVARMFCSATGPAVNLQEGSFWGEMPVHRQDTHVRFFGLSISLGLQLSQGYGNKRRRELLRHVSNCTRWNNRLLLDSGLGLH